ncbi:hypothetical protein VU10_03325 [Desulfobulbus sp. US1]|nr:hypothetical protein [Desulfobulbus sp. US4]MCW5209221.1 hypothetical protein [Desulfobulbus sp. US1]WLE97897.1 MAG: hypothetical protein QTN59_03465 [Candidatus Electrothrix communis]
MTNQELAEIAEMFLREYNDVQKSRKTPRQAIVYVDTLVNTDPKKALELLATIIDCCKNNKELAYVAAGPLENLFVYHGYAIIDKIKEKADCSEKFQLALSGVWLDEDEDIIFFRWVELMKLYNFTGDNPRQVLQRI